MGLFNWIKNVFSSDATKETNMLAVSESEINKSKKLRDESIITNSQLYIKQIRDLTILTNKTIYHDKFKEVLELTSKIHDKIIETEKVSINRLEQFHKYFSDEFVNTFDDALDDLRPKKEVDEKLKASFILQEEINKEKRDKELKEKESLRIKEEYDKINSIKNMKIEEKINLLLKSINPKFNLIQEKEYYDIAEVDKFNNTYITFGDKFTKYLKENWTIGNDVVFVGELNDGKESPIIYNTKTFDVFKLFYDSKKPEKIGNVDYEMLKEIISNKHIAPKSIKSV